jgi:hypothetical protein
MTDESFYKKKIVYTETILSSIFLTARLFVLIKNTKHVFFISFFVLIFYLKR